ncbi:MAG: hypothetical protein Fur0018_04620 [Anaerolineales bacterium]
MIQQTLQETGDYEAMLVRSAREALQAAEKRAFIIAVVDADLPDMALQTLLDGLQACRPALRFVLITPNVIRGAEQAHHGVCGYLKKPFYLPDLLEVVQQGLETTNPSIERVKTQPLPEEDEILPDVVRPVSRGTNTRPVPQAAPAPPWLMDVNRTAQHLMRLSLTSSAQAALIVHRQALWAYAGGLSQPAAQELAHAVAQHWTSGGGSDLARFIRLGATGSEYMLYATGLGGEFVLAMAFEAEMPFSEIRSQAGSLARALAEPPSSPPADAPQDSSALPSRAPLSTVLPPQGMDFSALERENRWMARPQQDSPSPEATVETEFSQEAASPQVAAPPESTSAPNENGGGQVITLEPESPAVYHLKYACVLIPRLPRHYLTGDLAARLAEWVGQLCVAFAWRLEYIALRPDHAHWIVSVPPDTSPSYLMRILRQHTSQRIFAEFPRLAEENPSGDFWAPGYLIMGSAQPAPPQLIRNFIRQTREYQGLA